MTFSVAIRQWDHPITVEMGQTIVEAAIAQGVPYPHGCRSGNCGACKSRLISGEVEMSPYSEFALSDAEKADGLVLACRSVPWEDVEIAWLGDDDIVAHPIRHLRCTVVALDELTHDIRRVRLKVDSGGPFTFSPGQYASLAFAGLPPRDYSMASLPTDPAIEFHIRHVADGQVSGHVRDALSVGESVRVEGPFGSSWLREGHTGPLFALAGGSGLAPILSILARALGLGIERPMHLYFGVRDERDLYLEDHFRALAAAHPHFRFTPVLSEPSAATSRRTGFLHDAVATDHADFDGAKAYLAGPPPMVEAATAMFLDRGLRREDIHADAFYTEAEKAQLENSS